MHVHVLAKEGSQQARPEAVCQCFLDPASKRSKCACDAEAEQNVLEKRTAKGLATDALTVYLSSRPPPAAKRLVSVI